MARAHNILALQRHRARWGSVRLQPYTTESLRPHGLVFSGIQPTGVPHLGNYLGALRQWARIQSCSPPSTKLFFSIVDLHALTVLPCAETMRVHRKETLAAILAIGLDPGRCTIFYQSDVSAHTDFMWILSCLASTGQLSRMTQWKSKLGIADTSSLEGAQGSTGLKLGLFSYPVLQASDVLVHRATHVPVGSDQVQHLEFARDCVDAFNNLYGHTLEKPEVLLSPAKRIMSLRQPTAKMSKSHPDVRSRILLSDSAEEIDAKIRAAVTDSETGITYDPTARPGLSNLLHIASHLREGSPSPRELAYEFKDSSMRVLKSYVASRITDSLAECRGKYLSLLNEPGARLVDVAFNGALNAQANALGTMKKINQAIGLVK